MNESRLQVLLNNEDLARGMARQVLRRYLLQIQPAWTHTQAYLADCRHRRRKTGLIEINFRQVNDLLNRDLNEWMDRVRSCYKIKFRPLVQWLASRIDQGHICLDDWVRLSVSDSQPSFMASVAQSINTNHVFVSRYHNIDIDQTVLVRNVINNEILLAERMRNKKPFWFVDSGYTNFLGRHKVWHRLVKNGMHFVPDLDRPWPADRLKFFSSWPRPWNRDGDAILVVENSESHYRMYGHNIESWRESIRKPLSRMTNREIVFRPKQGTRKDRESVYTMLSRDPERWYCVISDSSSAAVEAIWCGIPVITMRSHVTNPVSRMSLNNINELYRGNLGNWLCALSYCQFTQDELESGEAQDIMDRWHA